MPQNGAYRRNPGPGYLVLVPELSTPSPSFVDPLNAATELRIAIIHAAMEVFRVTTFHEASLEVVAEAAGLPLERVQSQFPTWDSLVLSTVDRWNAERMAPLRGVSASHGTVAFLRGIVQANIDDPALMRLLTSLLGIAATPGHPMAPLLHQDWHRFHSMVQASLARDVEMGREPETMDPTRGAEQLIALYEGLQLQSMVRPRMDLLDAYDRAVTRLRHGWKRAYVAPVWNLDS